MIFIDKLGALLKAHVPLMSALELLSNTCTTAENKIITSLKKSLTEGLPLSQALAKFPILFDTLTIHLIKAGEESASLSSICEHISNYSTKLSHLKRRIKKALFYPVLLLSITLCISIGLLVSIVPQFEQLFENAGAKLPILTQLILSISTFAQQNFLLIIVVLISIIGLAVYYRKSLTHVLYYLPFLSSIAQKTMLSRLSYTLSVVLTAGIPLPKSLQLSAQVLQHHKIEKALREVHEEVIKGEKLSQAFEHTRTFPPLFIQFLVIGEQSSSIAFYLKKLADIYDEEAQQQLNTLTFLIEPLMMLVLGLVIGGMIIAMYLPIFELGKVV